MIQFHILLNYRAYNQFQLPLLIPLLDVIKKICFIHIYFFLKKIVWLVYITINFEDLEESKMKRHPNNNNYFFFEKKNQTD